MILPQQLLKNCSCSAEPRKLQEPSESGGCQSLRGAHDVKVNDETRLSSQCTQQYNTRVVLERTLHIKHTGPQRTKRATMQLVDSTPVGWPEDRMSKGQKQAGSQREHGAQRLTPQKPGWHSGLTRKLKAPEEP